MAGHSSSTHSSLLRPSLAVLCLIWLGLTAAADTTIVIDKTAPPPAWALAERRLIALNGEGVRLWRDTYLDANGYLKGAAHFGIEDGPDDAVESIRNWPLAHALGGPDSIIEAWDLAWEGHLISTRSATDPSTELAQRRDVLQGVPESYDWEHIGEGLGPFYWYGLSRPTRRALSRQRSRRFAGFYLNEDPDARNYDAKLKLIPSLFNGSRGAKLTANTPGGLERPAAAGHEAEHAVPEGHQHPRRPSAQPRRDQSRASRLHADQRRQVPRPGCSSTSMPGRRASRPTAATFRRTWDATARSAASGAASGTAACSAGTRPTRAGATTCCAARPKAFGNALLLTGNQAYTQVLRRQIDNLYAASKSRERPGAVAAVLRRSGLVRASRRRNRVGRRSDQPPRGRRRTCTYGGSKPGDLELACRSAGGPAISRRVTPAYPLAAFQQGIEEIRRTAARLRADTSTPISRRTRRAARA